VLTTGLIGGMIGSPNHRDTARTAPAARDAALAGTTPDDRP
jgi:hypothetical protein